MTIKCCRDCPDRELGCHGWCEKYLAAKNRIAEMHAEKDKIRDIIGYSYERIREGATINAKARQQRRRWRFCGRR